MTSTRFVSLVLPGAITMLTIYQSITQLLKSAGLAIKALTAIQDDATSSVATTESEMPTFKEATDSYLESVHSVDIRLKRHIFGLAEAGIVDFAKATTQSNAPEVEKTREGGKVNLDIGWLNSRSGKVGRDKEAELWAKAREHLGKTKSKQVDGKTIHENGVDGQPS
jgi:hypothetical protein